MASCQADLTRALSPRTVHCCSAAPYRELPPSVSAEIRAANFVKAVARWAKSRSRGTATYFLSVIGSIVLINTPIPKVILAALLGDTAGTSISSSLRTLSRDLFLLLLVSLYFEWAKSREQVQLLEEVRDGVGKINSSLVTSTTEAIRQLAIAVTTPEELLRAALGRHLPEVTDVKTILARVLSTRPAYRDVTVEIEVENVDADAIRLASRTSFNTSAQEALFGVTRDSLHTAALSSTYPDLLEVFTFPGIKFEDIVSPHTLPSIRLHRKSISGQPYEQIPIARLTAKIDPDLFSRLPAGMNESDVAFFRPAPPARIDGPTQFRIDLTWKTDPSVRFFFWYADRPMFVRQLTFDARRLVREDRSVTFQPFLGSMDDLLIDVRDGFAVVRLNAWIFEGNGAVMLW